MYKYKRGVGSIEQASRLEYTITDNKKTCLSMLANLDIKKPYNGMYIQNAKVKLLTMMDKVCLKDKEYNIGELTTSIKSISSFDYLTSIDLEKNRFEYNLGFMEYYKEFSLKDGILKIGYYIKNKHNSKFDFKIFPIVTYRELFNMKAAQHLRFNQRNDKDGVMINLSIVDQENIVLKSKELSWVKINSIVNNIKHEFTGENGIRETYSEDAAIPGEFEVSLKADEEKSFEIYVSDREFEIEKIKEDNIFLLENYVKKDILDSIEDEYVELKEMAAQITNMYMEDTLVSKMPYEINYNSIFNDISNLRIEKIPFYIDDLIDIVRSIDGEYLSFNKLKEATICLVKIRRYIKIIKNMDISDNLDIERRILLLELWYVESAHRLIQKDNNVELFYDFVRDIIKDVQRKGIDSEYLQDIEIVSLLYNALKVYENILSIKGIEDVEIYEFIESLNKAIEEKFWIEDKRIMKRNLNEIDEYPNIEMIYTISLSYPCIVGDKPIKLLDTIFKELYTPYGLREVPKWHEKSKGTIYPKYMAHFVKANLRQNGVTRASQKIAFNMVKELMQDISKHVNGGIKKVYSEKGISIDSSSYDLLTNAEIIRLYDMLT